MKIISRNITSYIAYNKLGVELDVFDTIPTYFSSMLNIIQRFVSRGLHIVLKFDYFNLILGLEQ